MSFEAVMPPFNSSDPSASFLSSSCLDFLLNELVPLAHRIANDLDAPLHLAEGGADSKTAGDASTTGAAAAASVAPSASTAAATGTQPARRLEDDEALDAVQYRLDMLGYRVGQGLVERYAQEDNPPSPSFKTERNTMRTRCVQEGWIRITVAMQLTDEPSPLE
jgi:hypothetical protein